MMMTYLQNQQILIQIFYQILLNNKKNILNGRFLRVYISKSETNSDFYNFFDLLLLDETEFFCATVARFDCFIGLEQSMNWIFLWNEIVRFFLLRFDGGMNV